MKIRTTCFMIILLNVISCKKETIDENTIVENCFLQEQYHNTTLLDIFEYDQNNRLIKMRRIDIDGELRESINYYYSEGLLVKISNPIESSVGGGCGFIDTYEYDNNGMLKTIKRWDSLVEDTCQIDILISTSEHVYNNSNNLDSIILIAADQADSVSFNKVVSIYDSNRNLKKSESYILDSLILTATFEYDTKRNPLSGYLGNGQNNLIKRVGHRHDIPIIDSETIYDYEYNEYGFPISRTRTYSNGVTEVYEFVYSCE